MAKKLRAVCSGFVSLAIGAADGTGTRWLPRPWWRAAWGWLLTAGLTSDTAARSALLSRDRSPFPATAFAITSRACPARSRSCPAERIPPTATWRQPPRPAWRASCPPGR